MAFDLAEFLKNLTTRPGVYLMYNRADEVIYIGKARNLKRRVSSYFQKTKHAPKTIAMLAQVDHVEVTVTHTETEALVLESNLIKQHRPRYNVLLRDDKSYPYLHLDTSHAFPRLSYHRGARKAKGKYFGPYPAAASARESLNLLQKVFPIRQCEDSFYKNRTRPCLQHQIHRCTAPCVGLVDAESYAEDVNNTIRFLEGRTHEIIDEMGRQMQTAAENLDFERAARLRDQIAALSKVQERQYVDQSGGGDFDIIAAAREQDATAVHVGFIRKGRHLGGKTFFPQHTEGLGESDVLASFLPQFYLDKAVPGNILVSHMPRNAQWIGEALAGEGSRVIISHPQRGPRRRWLDMALVNAFDSLRRRLAGHATVTARFEAIGLALDLPETPERIECFDISHTMGEATVASCVVFDAEGPRKQDYRRYNINDITPGDDYAAMRQVLMRRYGKVQSGEAELPDLILIDGGRGQLNAALEAIAELGLHDAQLAGVAKGAGRRAGLEEIILPDRAVPLILPPDSPALLGIQQIRDEAHRFAITGHRARRAKARTGSSLDEIGGVGPKRRQALLKAFGGLKGVSNAGVEDLARVPGIDHNLAQRIYDELHPNRA
ncbi:excinuclease ABC subunit UvrC [Thermithiobacillus plumbiphilus]|uniref:UvrABC system protein C n=1 Tax=Thermithiobacillus plumbiphilus TaxID=1729899 RepID=A0ABU9D3S0_9PROT